MWRGGRLVGRLALIAAALVLLGLFAVPWALRQRVTAALQAAGFTQARYATLHLGWTGADLSGIALDPASPSRGSLAGSYSLGGLFAGRLDRVVLSDLTLVATVGDDGTLQIAGRQPATGSGAGGIPALPVARIEFRNVRLLLETVIGTVSATLNGVAVPVAAGGWNATGALALAAPVLTADAGLAMQIGTDGALSAKLNFTRIDSTATMVSGGATGTLTVALPAAGPITASGSFAGQTLRLFGKDTTASTLRYEAGTAGHHGVLQIKGTDAGTSLNAIASTGLRDDGHRVTQAKLEARVSDLATVRTDAAEQIFGRGKLLLSVNALLDLPPAGAGTLTGTMRWDGPATQGTSFDNANLQVTAAIEPSPQTLRISTDKCLSLTANRIVLAGGSLDQVALCAHGPDTAPMLSLQGGTLTADIVLGKSRLTSRIGPALALELDSGRLQRGADRAIALALAGTLAGAKPAELVARMPFSLSGQGAAGAPVALQGKAEAAGKVATIALTGNVDPDFGSGALRLAMPPVSFADGKPALAAISPLLARNVGIDSGRVGLDVNLGWGTATTTGARLLLDRVTGAGHGIAVTQLAGVITLTDLVRPTTAPGQRLAMAGVTAGLPLGPGEVQFALAEGRRLTVDRAAWPVAGGELRADPGTVDLSGEGRLVLRAERIDLQQLLQLAQVEGLAATGTLRGTLPLRLSSGTAAIDDGVLETVGPGQVRYAPKQPPSFLTDSSQGGSAILAAALKNFQYQAVTLHFSGVVGAEQKMKLALKGANPELYGGYPMSLNVNLSGALDQILSQQLGAWQLPDDIRTKIESFGGEIGK